MLNRLLTIPTNDADIQRRGRTVLSVALVLLGVIALAGMALTFRPDPIPSLLGLGLGTLLVITAMVLAHRGQVGLASWILVLMIIGAALLPTMIRHEVTSSLLYLTLPVVVAGVVLRPWQVWVVLGIGLVVVAYKAWIRAPTPLPQYEAWVLLINSGLVMVTLGIVSFLSAQIAARAFIEASSAKRLAEDSAIRLELLNRDLERQVQVRTTELRMAFEHATAQANEKQALLDQLAEQQELIREMSVPVLPVSEQTLVMPLIGALDSRRLVEIQAQALSALERSRAHTLLIDLTGVPIVDTQVAQGLMQTVQAARLLGTTVVLIGIRPEVAQSIVGLGIDLSEVHTASDLASALFA
jgi:rsbT co-antagonist protein RsbR